MSLYLDERTIRDRSNVSVVVPSLNGLEPCVRRAANTNSRMPLVSPRKNPQEAAAAHLGWHRQTCSLQAGRANVFTGYQSVGDCAGADRSGPAHKAGDIDSRVVQTSPCREGSPLHCPHEQNQSAVGEPALLGECPGRSGILHPFGRPRHSSDPDPPGLQADPADTWVRGSWCGRAVAGWRF